MPVGLLLFLSLFRSSHYGRFDHKYFTSVTYLKQDTLLFRVCTAIMSRMTSPNVISFHFLFKIDFQLFYLLFIILWSKKCIIYQLKARERHVFIFNLNKFTKIAGKLQY